jgi:hypothetical protein
MDCSCCFLFLVATAIGKGLPIPKPQEGPEPDMELTHSISSPQVSIPRSTTAVWGWVEDARGFSKVVLQDFWVHLHQLQHALGEAGVQPGTWVDRQDSPWQWCSEICSKLPGKSQPNSEQVLQHSFHVAEQADRWQLVLCERHSVKTSFWKCQKPWRRRQLSWAEMTGRMEMKYCVEKGLN